MKQFLLRIPGLAILVLFIQTSGIAQQEIMRDNDDDGPRKYDEITIRHKAGKDAKVTIEIKDGDVLVNGKPISDFEDSTLSIHRRKVMRYSNGSNMAFPEIVPDVPMAPLDNAKSWSFSNDNVFRSNRAMLGVATIKKDDVNGATVTQVTKGSAAEKMGLKPGDIITKVDEEDISDAGSLSNAISSHEAGEEVTITFMRDGKEQKATGELGKGKSRTEGPVYRYNFKMPEIKSDLPRGPWPNEVLQFRPNSLKFGIRAQDAEDGKGVKVLDVDDESTAAKAGIKEGDIITRFDGKDINSVMALTDAAHAAKDKTSVKVTIVRDGKPQEIEVRVPKLLRTADL